MASKRFRITWPIAAILVWLAPSVLAAVGGDMIPANDARVAVMGRVDPTALPRLRFGYPGVTLRLRFEGSSLAMRAIASTPNCHLDVLVDGGEQRLVHLTQGESEVTLASALPAGEHSVDVVHRTETWVGVVTVVGFRLPEGGQLLAPNPWPQRRLLFLGDSVTCGEGVERSPGHRQGLASDWNPYLSYGMRLARTFDAQGHLVCYGGRGLTRDWQGKRDVLNAPQFFDLAVPDELGAPAWDHSLYVPDVIVVSLGTNDFNLAIGEFPEREEWVTTYVRFVRAIRSRYPEAHIFLTEGAIVNDSSPPGRAQKSVLRSYLAEIAARLADPRVHVFESRHYPGDETDAHPAAAQHAAMARDVEPIIRAAVSW